MSFTREDYENRVMTLKEGEVIIPVKIRIKTTQPIIYMPDAELELKSIETYPCTDIRTTLEIVDLLEDGTTLRYKFLQKFREATSNREGTVFYDRLLKDIIILPNIEHIDMVPWRQIKNDIICGYRVGSGKPLGYSLNKSELSVGMDVNDMMPIPEPEKRLGVSHLIDAYGLQPGDSGSHYNNVLYYERPKDHNGFEVNFGVQRYQTDTTNMLELGSIAEMYPGGLTEGIPIYGTTQPDVSFFSAELLGKRVIPRPTDKLYVIIDI
jgi:hypothetical protein